MMDRNFMEKKKNYIFFSPSLFILGMWEAEGGWMKPRALRVMFKKPDWIPAHIDQFNKEFHYDDAFLY